MRVRLVRPLIAEIAQIDTAATDALDLPGPATSGYDPDFREPVVAGPISGIGQSQRQEKTPVQIPAQIEVTRFEELQQSFSGDIPDSKMALVMDFEDLIELGLVDPISNEATIRKNDRLVRILSGAGEEIQSFPNPPGMFVTEVRPRHGLEADRNILLAFLDDREHGIVRGI